MLRRKKYTITECPSCKKTFRLEQNVKEQRLSGEASWRYDIVCPHCEHTITSVVMTKGLERMRKELEDTLKQAQTVKTEAARALYKKRQEAYKVAFDLVNAK